MVETPKNSKERVWTETELKYLALILTDQKTQFAVRLDTLALKKSSNNKVFEDISKAFELATFHPTCTHAFPRASFSQLVHLYYKYGTNYLTNCESYSSSCIYTRHINY